MRSGVDGTTMRPISSCSIHSKHAALVHVAVDHDLVDVAHRRPRNALPFGKSRTPPSCRSCASTPRPVRRSPRDGAKSDAKRYAIMMEALGRNQTSFPQKPQSKALLRSRDVRARMLPTKAGFRFLGSGPQETPRWSKRDSNLRLGLTRFGGHPESLARGAADAKNTSTVFAGVSPTDGRPRPCWT